VHHLEVRQSRAGVGTGGLTGHRQKPPQRLFPRHFPHAMPGPNNNAAVASNIPLKKRRPGNPE
jgi:hypothetical protein